MFEPDFLKTDAFPNKLMSCFFGSLVCNTWRPLKGKREGARVSGSGNQIINVTAAADQISQVDLI